MVMMLFCMCFLCLFKINRNIVPYLFNTVLYYLTKRFIINAFYISIGFVLNPYHLIVYSIFEKYLFLCRL